MKKIILKNATIELVLINVGASIYDFKYKGRSLVKQASSLNNYYENLEYIGATVGPLAGRYNMDGEVILHSANDTFHNKEFAITKQHQDTVEFSYGYLTVIYTLHNEGFRIEYRSTSDSKIPLNITNHSYFCLDDNHDVNTHIAFIKSNYMSLKNDNALAIGVKANNIHRIDFDKTKVDDYYYFCEKKTVELFSTVSNIRLTVNTSYPGVVLYTYNQPRQENNKHSAIAVECQYAPNTIIMTDNYREYIEYIVRG